MLKHYKMLILRNQVTLMKQNITYIINTSEITAGTRGASLGPGAVIVEARKKNNGLFGEFPTVYVEEVNYFLDKPIVHTFAKRAEGLIKVYDSVSKEIDAVLSMNRFPLVLSGDHGSAGGTIAGIKAHFLEKRIGVVWIDAHGDLHTPFTTPSGNMHGMPLSTALNDDNKEVQRNNVPDATVELWEKLKKSGYQGAKIQAEDLVFIGVRDVEEEEVALMDRLQIKNFTVEEVRRSGVSAILDAVDQKLSNCDVIYVSFDVDSMDPVETSYGTGTPVENGLFVQEARELLVGFAKHPKLICMEFVEVNPCLDEKRNKMAEVTFELFEDVVKTLKK